MPTIVLETFINAPIERCFDLARSIELHTDSMRHTGEQAVAGRTSGMIGPGETVTWRAKHLGIWQTLTSRITEYNRPEKFTDEMVNGAFKSFRHEHHFVPENGQTLMRDVFTFQSPLGALGWLADRLFLKSYLRRLLTRRNETIKQAAENG
jgi:ligand-binding SRPBCC domain-containing protein